MIKILDNELSVVTGYPMALVCAGLVGGGGGGCRFQENKGSYYIHNFFFITRLSLIYIGKSIYTV